MKRVGYLLFFAVASLALYTWSLAQLESRAVKYLSRVLTGTEVRGYFGTAVESAYAYTGAAPLFAISVSGETDGPVRSGKVCFYDSPAAENATLIISAPAAGELFGIALSGGGDWNGDGVPDLAVGASCGATPVTSPAGKVYIYLGGPDFGKSQPAMVTAGEKADGFGEAVNLKHDINGDGLADLIVGAPRSMKSGATAGRAYVWFGKKSGSPAQKPDMEITLGTTNDHFGTAIATGDISGDGLPDLVIGSPQYNIGPKTVGGVFIFHGGEKLNLATASQVLVGEGTAFQDYFGKSVAIIPDLNDDKISELLVGAPQVVKNAKQVGQVYLYHGGAKIEAKAAATFSGDVEAGRFGNQVFSLGDINADGKGDWAVQNETEGGSRGALHLFYGGWEREFYRFPGESVADRLGTAASPLADPAKTSGKEILVGARWNDAGGENAGRVYVLTLD